MIALLWLFTTILASPFKSKCQLEVGNAALRHQVMVLRRQAGSWIHLTNVDRLFFVQLYRSRCQTRLVCYRCGGRFRRCRQAASECFGAVTANMKLEPFLKPEFAVCPPSDVLRDSKGILDQMILSITAYLKSHPEQRPNNFHQTAVTALVAAWPCAK